MESNTDNYFDAQKSAFVPVQSTNHHQIYDENVVQDQEDYNNTDTEDVISYQEKTFNKKSLLCWMERITITEDKICCNKTISKEYTVILASASSKNSTPNLNKPLFDQEGKYDMINPKNFTIVRETTNVIITENRNLICGFGPVVTKQYSKWPKSRSESLVIKLASEVSNPIEQIPYDQELPIYPLEQSTEASTSFNTLQTPPTLTFRNKKISEKPIEGDKQILEQNLPQEIRRSSRKFFQANSKNINQKSYLLEHNISYQNSNNSQILKNPFDDTNLINRLKHLKKPILFNVLFPDEIIFRNMHRNNTENRYKVTVKLSVTLQELTSNTNSVTLKLSETSLIVLN